MTEPGPAERPKPAASRSKAAAIWRLGLLSGVSGLLFSLVVAAVTSAALLLHLWPFTRIEEAGIDLGMKVYAAASQVISTPLRETRSFLFVDVDEEACRTFRRVEPWRCRTENPVSAELMKSLVDAATNAGASLIVVDVAPAEDRLLYDNWTAAIAPAPAPPVIMPPPARPNYDRDGRLQLEFERPFLPSAKSRVLFANFMTGPGVGPQDGMARNLSPAIALRDARAPDGNGQFLPSASLLVALLGEPRPSAAPCIWSGPRCGSAQGPDAEQRRRVVDQLKADPRIFFAFGDLSLDHSGLRPPLNVGDGNCLTGDQDPRAPELLRERAYAGVFRHVFACALLKSDGSGFRWDRNAFAGRVVVLGSSLISGGDLHQTPIGAMTGSEVLINAVYYAAMRLEAGPGANDPRGLWLFLQTFGQKALGALVGALLLLPIWFAIHAMLRNAQGTPFWRRLGLRAAATVVFLVGLALIASFEIYGATRHLAGGHGGGHFVDMLTPIVALGLEAFAEASVFLFKQFERGLERLLEALADLLEAKSEG
jgi:CHASE2 domain-containing sensor protein